MATYSFPTVGSRFVNVQGESLQIIGRGTGGVVVEYVDGRVELMDLQTWGQEAPHLSSPIEELAHVN